ncbi:MAG: tetratricopeptide repeat protein [Planctomycetaceae bacterium]|jgi:Tfp pilus assembly protein PilF
MPDRSAESSRSLLPVVVLGLVALLGAIGWWLWQAVPPEIPRKEAKPSSPAAGTAPTASPPATLSVPALPKPEKPEPPPEGYVGSRSCAVCHSEIAEQYAGHSMSQSLAAMADARVIEDYDQNVTFTKGGCEYRVEPGDDGIYHHERLVDGEGQVYDQRVEVQYVVGSGQRGRSYFIDRGGVMFMSPISWYSQQNRWDLSPGYTDRNHLRFERPVSGRCLGCHAGRVNAEAGENDRFNHPTIREAMISCERCHGPGKEHVAYHRSSPTPEGPDPIVNPAQLPPSKREAVCNACHLQGIEEVRRYGRTDFDFRPGMDLGEVWSIFVEGTGVNASGETTAVSHVQQMHASRCYLGSEGKLGCITCHDPHRLAPEETRAAEFNQKCATCHATQKCALPEAEQQAPPATGSCVACHMPRLGSHDVPHTTQTDHRILRRRPSPGEPSAKPVSEDDAKTPENLQIFDLAEVPLDQFAKDRALGIALAARAEQAQDKDRAARAIALLGPVSAADPLDGAVADAYGISLALTGEVGQAIETWKAALRANTRNEALLYSLGLAYFTAGEHAEAMQYFDRLVTVNPHRSDYQGQRARLLLANGKTREAIETASYARELNPSMPLVYEWLAFACEREGDIASADRYRNLQKRVERR